MLKSIFCFSVCLCTIALPALAELTPQELNQIRLIIKEEIKEEINPIKTEIASIKTEIASIKTEIGSVKIDVAWIRGKLDTFDKHITWLMALIAVAVVIPTIVISWRDRKDRVQQRQIESLMEEIEKLKQQRIVDP
jgi:septal ring factor EnvC (AmiA/AmiB activator)